MKTPLHKIPIKERVPVDNIVFMFQDRESAETVLEYIKEHDYEDMNWRVQQEGEDGEHAYYLINNYNQTLGVIKY